MPNQERLETKPTPPPSGGGEVTRAAGVHPVKIARRFRLGGKRLPNGALHDAVALGVEMTDIGALSAEMSFRLDGVAAISFLRVLVKLVSPSEPRE